MGKLRKIVASRHIGEIGAIRVIEENWTNHVKNKIEVCFIKLIQLEIIVANSVS